jgi:hypothetical protein
MWAERQGVEVDLFQESNWQRNTTSAVAPLRTAAPTASGFDIEQRHLDAARQVLTTLPMPTARPLV